MITGAVKNGQRIVACLTLVVILIAAPLGARLVKTRRPCGASHKGLPILLKNHSRLVYRGSPSMNISQVSSHSGIGGIFNRGRSTKSEAASENIGKILEPASHADDISGISGFHPQTSPAPKAEIATSSAVPAAVDTAPAAPEAVPINNPKTLTMEHWGMNDITPEEPWGALATSMSRGYVPGRSLDQETPHQFLEHSMASPIGDNQTPSYLGSMGLQAGGMYFHDVVGPAASMYLQSRAFP
jgi:hypothetical protein